MITDNEWKEVYHDGLTTALTVVQTVADDGGSAAEAAELLRALADSRVLDTPEGTASTPTEGTIL